MDGVAVTDANPYEGMTDEQVLAEAMAAYRRAEAMPPHSPRRGKEWEVFDRAMLELCRRAMADALWKIHQRETGGAEGDTI